MRVQGPKHLGHFLLLSQAGASSNHIKHMILGSHYTVPITEELDLADAIKLLLIVHILSSTYGKIAINT